jgi:multiple antibiotic resistance protein
MITFIISFLVLLNPFALFVYLIPLKKERGIREFANILLRASVISLLIYVLFAVFGGKIFETLNVNFESFRIFGGVVLASLALSFILQGKKSMIATRGELSQIAAEIALPFIVGVGTITQAIIIGELYSNLESLIILLTVMCANFGIVLGLAYARHILKDEFKEVLDKNAEILLRINGFIVGAYGVNLIVAGITNIVG